ncbi:MAG: hypothetical protein H7Y12_14425 [Sphingobacteriaceae bacterium]|nr:hypothetical protein [Cytophagaceae bacterium]
MAEYEEENYDASAGANHGKSQTEKSRSGFAKVGEVFFESKVLPHKIL